MTGSGLAPLRSGLPTRVADGEWMTWLASFPDRPPVTLGNVMVYRGALTRHLDEAPDADRLSPDDRRRVADDLANYCRTLQIEQRAGVNTTILSTGLSGANLAGAMFIPGAKIALLAVGFGVAVLTALKTYDARRRQSTIDRLIAKIDDLSWDLKQ